MSNSTLKKSLIQLVLYGCTCISAHTYAYAYLRCSEEQQDKIIQKFNLLTHKFEHTDAETFKSCINLDDQQNLQLLAISQPIQYKNYNEMEHDLNLYVIDSNKNKILQRYKDQISHETDAERYDGVNIHTTKFSNLTNINVIGVETGISHEGGFTYRHNNLALFKINPNQPIKEIFSGIGTDESGYERIGSCDGNNTSSQVNRILILSNKITNGLQDIILKETKDQTKTNYKTCKSVKRQFKQQQILKFNGKEYKFQHNNLLGIDPF